MVELFYVCVVTESMIEKIALRVFWTMMLLCASTVLALIWFEPMVPERLAPTFFVIGFASFLIWAPIVAYRFLHAMK